MSKYTYLKEHFYILVLGALLSALQGFFLLASKLSIDTVILFLVSIWSFIFGFLFIEYRQKNGYYKQLKDQLERLDQKSLLIEVIDEPEFQEGRILYQTLEEINKNYNDRIATYEKREKDYKEYIEMWIHEIKSPLTAAKLMNTNHPSGISKALDLEIERMNDYIEQALYYAKSSDPSRDYVLKEIQLSDSINAAVRRLKQRFIYKEIKLSITNSDHMITMDSKWLEFILHQILDNALKYTDVGGSIHIDTVVHDQDLEVRISDTGIGIDPKDVSRVFDRGFTGENGRLEKKATGMGLYLCKALCDKLYMSIRLDSTVHKGTCVSITIPNSRFYKNLL
ncbi:hypothetical protein EDD63_1467 [Breznakia blatticola]|uniref:histidine kinase n=1 Tax=Breznakia blatticola TaxID=1754012 RepID=A0A4R7Z8W5_9FIRM|nr:sensor histidine kinase [Breznakia blatticola]TDW13166.1 hypothetical protein EDD63_1467 [Breznakia blatticola]